LQPGIPIFEDCPYRECSLCLENIADVLFQPCGCMSLCSICAAGWQKTKPGITCPTCRAIVTSASTSKPSNFPRRPS
jgi:hypothetical protein